MAEVEVNLPDRVDTEIDQLVEQGEFLNREQAVEDLLSRGISAYTTTDDSDDVAEESLFTQRVDDQQDPALQDEPDQDDYTF